MTLPDHTAPKARRGVTGLVLTLGLGLSPALAWAQDPLVVFAGGTYDSASYGNIGAQVGLSGPSATQGFAVRASGFLGQYGYNESGGTRVRAHFAGGELDGVYQFTGGWGYADLFAGARYSDTRLNPLDTGNRRRGGETEAVLGSDGARAFGPWRADWYGAYGAGLDDYQTRISLTHRVNDTWRLGGEAAFEGDPTYSLQRFGPYVGLRLGARSELQASAGVSHQSGLGEHAYVRLNWYHAF
jgi:hypothetical protein